MITVVSEPGTYNGVKNPIKYVLQTDNYLQTAGTKARIDITLTNTPANDDWFELVIEGETIRFTAKTSPNNSGTQLQLNGTSLSGTNLMEQKTIPDLLKNIAFADYAISVLTPGTSTVTIRIEAKNIGSQYDITFADSSGGFYSSSSATAGTDNVYRENFRIFADLFLQAEFNIGSFNRIGANLEYVPNSSNQCTVDVSDYIKPYIKYPVPTNAALLLFAPANVLPAFYIRHAESFGDPALAQAYIATTSVLAFNGGKAFKNIGNNYDAYFTATLQSFLTNMPSGVEVAKSQKQFLTFYLNEDVFSVENYIQLLVKLNYTDGTSSAYLNAVSLPLYNKRLITAKVGYTQLDIDTLKASGKTVASYDIKIRNEEAEVDITNPFRFKVAQKQSLSNRYFLFFNAFGQPETMLFTGNQSRSIALDNEVVRRTGTNQSGNTFSGEYDEINNELRASYKLSTGYKPKYYIQYFNDFLLSENRYEQVGDNYHKMVMPAQKISLDNDRDTNFSLDFNYMDAWIERGNG
jgi:hypothetical protein